MGIDVKKLDYREVGRWHPDVYANDNGTVPSEQVRLAVLLVMRDQLIEINRKLSVLECSRFTRIPDTLNKIDSNTRKRKRKSRRA